MKHVFVFNDGKMQGKAFETYELEHAMRPGYIWEFDGSSEMYEITSVTDCSTYHKLVQLKRVNAISAFFKRLRWLVKGTL